MPCFHPLKGWKGPGNNGKGKVVFSPEKSYFPFSPDLCRQDVPCGQCLGCRLAHRQRWTIRNVHENSMHKDSCFGTFTYSEENMPLGGVVEYRDWQLFMMRLRKKFPGVRIRFFGCFEYGETKGRGHFHALLYGIDFRSDARVISRRGGVALYESPTLTALWGHGHASFGDVTQDSISYVAGYTTKASDSFHAGDPDPDGKYHGVIHKARREVVDTESGEIYLLPRERIFMSRRPGIGADWFHKFKDEFVSEDRILLLGKRDPRTGFHTPVKEVPVPKYYTRLLEKENPALVEKLKADRQAHMDSPESRWNNSPERLRVRKACLIGRGVKKRDQVG